MLKMFGSLLTYLLACYGVISLLIAICNSISQKIKYKKTNIKMVLLVKNQEETIEGVVRNIFSEETLRKTMSIEKPAIIDMDSTDKTMEILTKLNRDYDYFDIYSYNNKEKIFACFEQYN